MNKKDIYLKKLVIIVIVWFSYKLPLGFEFILGFLLASHLKGLIVNTKLINDKETMV